ncbi:MAG: hypothetical protein FJ104_05835 [Deltaproteobacteria bacterium]|nr:hypothetical protein [Deltaproteobacteria bacterium]
MGPVVDAALAVLVPSGVGAAMYVLFDLWDRLRRRGGGGEGLPRVDYTI